MIEMFRVCSRYAINRYTGRNLASSLLYESRFAPLVASKSTDASSTQPPSKKYTRPPPIDLKSVRTNKGDGSTDEKSSSRQSSKIGGLLLLSIPAITFALGVWQVFRREQKLKLIEFLNSRTKSEPIELPTDSSQLDSLVSQHEYRAFRVRGHFLHSKEILLTMRHDLSGHTHLPGGFVITPFVLSADPNIVILVNRGYVPYTNFSPMSRRETLIENEVEVVGLLRSNEPATTFTPVNVPPNEWHYRDVDQISRVLGTKPIFLDAVSTSGLKNDTFPIPGQTAIQLRNEHLMYIITWFSLSVITSILWWRRFKNVFF